MSHFLTDHCTLHRLAHAEEMAGFTCGDADLDEFFTAESIYYAKELLGKSYYYALDEQPHTVVCAFTLSNASIRVDDLPYARRKKLETNIPHVKSLKDYPAVLIGRLGVSQDFHSLHIGSEALEYIKYWLIEPNNKTGCRFLIVDAYNDTDTKAFYERNGFKPVFSTDEQEKDYRHISPEVRLTTRLMYFDLLFATKD